MSDKQMLLIITAYNCEGRILKTLNQLDSSVMKYISSVLILDSCSTDNTNEEIVGFIARHPKMPIKIASSTKHSGLGTSMKYAFSYAIKNNYRYVMTLKGDNQVDIHDFLIVLKKQIYKEKDCILGARFMTGSHLHGYSKRRIIGNVLLNLLYSAACKQKIYDCGAGINIYSIDMLKNGLYERFPENNLFFSSMLLVGRHLQANYVFCPITAREDGMEYPVKMINQAMFLIKWAFLFMTSENEKG